LLFQTSFGSGAGAGGVVLDDEPREQSPDAHPALAMPQGEQLEAHGAQLDAHGA
jgi:hypothetical protein